jgi:hypothetical protein
MNQAAARDIRSSLETFVGWLDRYGETSHDQQSFFAGPVGGAAKSLYYRHRSLGTLAVAPMIVCEAFMPSARALFWKRTRFPIADAHYASGFAFLAQSTGRTDFHERAVHFLEALVATRCPGFDEYAWGYPFDWVTVMGTLAEGTPMVTTINYAYEAFRQVCQLDGDVRWRDIMRSIAEHARRDYRDFPTSSTARSCAYTPLAHDSGGVINASAYRACLLTTASRDFGDERYASVAEGNLAFVLESQNADGSWFYSADGKRDFVDHYHTCFVLKALAKIEALTGNPACSAAIARGVDYYVRELFEDGLPRPFTQAPRMTVYRRELYDYAECINLAALLCGRFPALDALLPGVLDDVMNRWRKPDGSFRSRQLLVGWDNVPMHRWAQSQLFRSLCFLDSRQPSAAAQARIQKRH